jgi:hypothetical protein
MRHNKQEALVATRREAAFVCLDDMLYTSHPIFPEILQYSDKATVKTGEITVFQIDDMFSTSLDISAVMSHWIYQL